MTADTETLLSDWKRLRKSSQTVPLPPSGIRAQLVFAGDALARAVMELEKWNRKLIANQDSLSHAIRAEKGLKEEARAALATAEQEAIYERGVKIEVATSLNTMLSILPRVLFKVIVVEHDRYLDGKPALQLAEIEAAFHEAMSAEFEEAGGTLPVVDYVAEYANLKRAEATLARVRTDIQRRLHGDDLGDKPYDEDLADAVKAIDLALAGLPGDQQQ